MGAARFRLVTLRDSRGARSPAGSGAGCRYQVWPHRVTAGFPYRSVSVAGKTGTIGVIRNEVAVVEFPGEHPVAVAIFTRAARADPHLPVVDAAIAVTELRLPLPGG